MNYINNIQNLPKQENYQPLLLPQTYLRKKLPTKFNQGQPNIDSFKLKQLAQKQIQLILPKQNQLKIKQQKRQAVSLFSKKQIFDSGIQFIRKNINTNIPTVKQMDSLPKSVQFLQIYSQSLGFAPMGSVLQKKGNNIIGRIQQIYDNTKYYRTFPQNQIVKHNQSPSLYTNFSSLANQAIFKWNQFIDSQTKLANYLQKVQTPQGRQQLMNQYVKLSNKGTNALRVLSSLAYYYLTPKSQNKNWLQLKKWQDVQTLKMILKTKGKPYQIYTNIYNFLMQKKQNVSNSKLLKISQFHELRAATMRQGLTLQQFSKIQPQLQQIVAYVPIQMINIPQRQTPQWYIYYDNIKKSQINNIILTQWYHNSNKSLKYINYL